MGPFRRLLVPFIGSWVVSSWLVACTVQTAGPDALVGADSPSTPPDFGDAYRVWTAGLNDDPGRTPAVVNDRLRLTVSYSGGCKTHRFTLASRLTATGADVWATHDANEDACEAYVTETLTLNLPDNVLQRSHIRLLAPGVDPVPLR